MLGRVTALCAKMLPEQFKEVYLVDTEFHFNGSRDAGELPIPLCLVARELYSDRVIRKWCDEFGAEPPYPIGPNVLFVAFVASAELGCHLALGWPMPARILDLSAEYKLLFNGTPSGYGRGLIGALTTYGLDSIGAIDKKEMHDLILSGGPWSDSEKAAILDYCQSDADALARLLPAMAPQIDLPRALVRGRYMAAVAHMERNGIPIDVPTWQRIGDNWEGLKAALVSEIDTNYDVYEGIHFRVRKWEKWLERKGIPWPRLPSGALDLDQDTFRSMAKAYPEVAPIQELRHALGQLRLNELAVGSDGRNRTTLWAFSSKTGRNQPSNSFSIFGPSVWIRSLIVPKPGKALAYIDWNQQEFGIGAALSGDQRMLAAYNSGDPYLGFAKQAGAAPPEATKETHKEARGLYKQVVLAVQYGMGEQSLACRIGKPPFEARLLLRDHHEAYPTFWEWSDRAVAFAVITGKIHTVMGWTLNIAPEPNDRSIRNFPMQANGADMLRLACCLATERGIKVCMSVHDAILIEADADKIDEAVAATQAAMAEASQIVLNGFVLRSEMQIVREGERYTDPRGEVMWEKVMKLLKEVAVETSHPHLCVGAQWPGFGPSNLCMGAQANLCVGARVPVRGRTPVQYMMYMTLV